jgi:hypothetical protein
MLPTGEIILPWGYSFTELIEAIKTFSNNINALDLK